ncbi:hypothetical protein BHM03_00007974 [Ensete ventricosum]|nr:hypothetical protein BHM03_00007974 [Ensete ventricosum]
MSSSSSNEERNFGDCSFSESSFSLDEKSSKVLEAILREHDEDSIITESSLSKIWAIYCIPGDFDIHVPEAEQHPFNTFPNGFSLSVDALEAGKARFLFVSAFRGWGFSLKWCGRDVDNSPPSLSKVEAKQVARLRGILSSLTAIKSMTKAWLEAASLSPAPEGMACSIRSPHGLLVLRHRPATELTAEKALSTEAEPPLKKLKKVGDSAVPAKEASPAPAPRPRSGP